MIVTETVADNVRLSTLDIVFTNVIVFSLIVFPLATFSLPSGLVLSILFSLIVARLKLAKEVSEVCDLGSQISNSLSAVTFR